MDDSARHGVFGSLFGRGTADTSDEAWLQAMLDAEAALARAAERAGLAPAGSGAAVTAAASARLFDSAKIGRAAAGSGNPVPALVRALTEAVPADAAPAIHAGATSQDIIDTAAMLIAGRAITAICADLRATAGACATLTRTHARTVMAGRTLLQQAVPVTFGLVTAGWLSAIDQARSGLASVRDTRLAIQYGGAAGTLASLADKGPLVATLLAEELSLAEPVLPWHTERLRIIDLAAALAAACAALGKIARDVTVLAQTEIAEVREQAGGGSSTMPHKRNPVAAVLVLGCARQAPNLLATLVSAAEQELQRAAGAWHSEWQPLTHLLSRTASAAAWARDLLTGLRIDPAAMRANLDATHGSLMAERLSAMLSPAMGRLAAHDLVASASARASDQGIGLSQAMLGDVTAAAQLAAADVSPDQLTAALDPGSYLGASQTFIDRALRAHEDAESALAP